ncbi:MAG: 16S rRNA (cytosine(967)-C(5))-methyltransferase RsmB [Ignavibacteria bacterium]|nr:16S rRNA (cytosine(967)-C(5))-methyltransferase RsmB [Ignavibacteria bacterium]
MNDQHRRAGHRERREQRSLYHGVRGTAVKILNRVERSDSFLDKVLDVEIKAGEWSDADKGLLTELVHGVLRWQNKLDWVLNGFSHGNFAKSEINVKNALRVGLYQIMFLDRIPHPAAVHESVEFVKRIRGDKPAGLVNAVLRNVIRNLDGIRYPDPSDDQIQHLAVVFSHPHWIVRRWVKRFGVEETQKLLSANNERPTLSVRINKLKVEPGYFLTLLEKENVEFKGSSHIDYFLQVKHLSRIGQMDLFRKGMFSIQDESAAIPCILISPKPGEHVIDLCAAPGGKTTNLAELMGNEGKVISVDRYEARLNLVQEACTRLGVNNVTLVVGDAATIDLDPADKVLLDAPCSGLGVLMKKPDIKWKRDASDILKLTQLQSALLENAARLVKPGGVLVYSTCTTEGEENQEQIAGFLERHPEFRIESAKDFVNSDLVTAEGFVETFPHRHAMDGSFAARLVKATTASNPPDMTEPETDHG